MGEVEGVFDYEMLLCPTCASTLRQSGPLPTEVDTMEALLDLQEVEARLVRLTLACRKCIAVFQAQHGPPKPL